MCNLHDKEKYVPHIRTLRQALNHGFIFKNVHKEIKFYQEAWLKRYLNTKLWTETKNNFEKNFFQLMNNLVFGKTIRNIIKHRKEEQ